VIDIQLKDTDLSPQECLDLVQSDGSGAIVSFVGTVRNQTKGKRVIRLDFEAYRPMALSEMEKIARKAKQLFEAEKIAIHHRVGSLGIGGIAVVIVVSTPHRAKGFKACQFCIDTLKEKVPIWKKEYFEDGEVWVAAHP